MDEVLKAEFERTLSEYTDPTAGLMKLVEKWKASGFGQKETFDRFEEFRALLRKEGREADEDCVMDVMDLITGWCSPHQRLFSANASDFAKVDQAEGKLMAPITIDLPDDVLEKLAIVVQNQSRWPTTPEPFNIEDLIKTVVSAYASEQVSDNGKVNPDLRAEGSPFIRWTNFVLVQAIDNGIFEFDFPPVGDAPLASLLYAFPDLQSPRGHEILQYCVRRLAIMTTPVTGNISVVHNDNHYNLFVEFDKTADGKHRVRVKITQSDRAE